MLEDLQTPDIRTRIGMMTGTTVGETLIAESIVTTTMNIMTTRSEEAQEMLTIAILMNL